MKQCLKDTRIQNQHSVVNRHGKHPQFKPQKWHNNCLKDTLKKYLTMTWDNLASVQVKMEKIDCNRCYRI